MKKDKYLMNMPCRILLLFVICLFFTGRGRLSAQKAGVSDLPFENYNVILIYLDTLRADHLSFYGYSRQTSPNLARLSKESVVFKQVFTPASYTLPSFMSIITSLYPNSHGVLSVFKDKLSTRVITLPQIFQAYGYKTVWFGPRSDPELDPEAGFGRGFDEFSNSTEDAGLAGARDKLCGWLEANRDKKFFLNFHTYKMHIPYLPLDKYKTRFTKIKSMPGVAQDAQEFYYGSVRQIMQDKKQALKFVSQDFYDQFHAAGLSQGSDGEIEEFFSSKNKLDKLQELRNPVYRPGVNFQEDPVKTYLKDLYDAAILEYDQEVIGPVIAKLKALKIYDRTIIVVCSDHGEEFGEHGGFTHGATLYDEVTHVPLIMRIPWFNSARQINALAQTTDILPTLLDLLRIPIPHQAQGKSFAGMIDDKRLPELHEYVFGRMPVKSSIRSRDWLLILDEDHPGQKEFYDLHADRGQHNNLYFQKQEMAAGLENKLKEWEKSLVSYRDQEYSFAPGIDKATQERIRKTGYW
jgi:arylsulfatase A-like enzyme